MNSSNKYTSTLANLLLPQARGRYQFNAPLANHVWFRVGGPAQVLFKPEDLADLQDFIKAKPADIEIMPIGVGSNLLVRDGGIDGVVVRLGRNFAKIELQGDIIICGAGALDRTVAMFCQEHGLGGLEFLYGIPGTIGGAVRMNAGAYGVEVKDCLVWAEAVDQNGELKRLSADELEFSYRHCSAPPEWIFVRAAFCGKANDPKVIGQRMQQIQENREASQPINARTGGSTFANPDGHKSWQLIDCAGCRGLTIGGAQVSEKHCNFLINTGTATAKDLETLGEEVRKRVLKNSGINLRWEIHRVGKK